MIIIKHPPMSFIDIGGYFYIEIIIKCKEILVKSVVLCYYIYNFYL